MMYELFDTIYPFLVHYMGLCEDDPSCDKTTMRLCLQVVPRHMGDIAASWVLHNDLLEIIHIDVCGPMSVEARGGYHYFMTFTDDLSRYGYIYLMKHKSKTFEKFKEFRVKWKIIVTRKQSFYDLIVEVNI